MAHTYKYWWKTNIRSSVVESHSQFVSRASVCLSLSFSVYVFIVEDTRRARVCDKLIRDQRRTNNTKLQKDVACEKVDSSVWDHDERRDEKSTD